MLIEFLFVLFCGLAFGSFVTCASYRLPLDQDIVRKPSYCPKCNVKLGFKDLWPVLSWVTSKGKCRHCAAPVSVRYPLTELATAAVFLAIYATYGLTPLSVVLALTGVTLMIMIVADLEHYIIPDQVHLALLPLALIYHYLIDTTLRDQVEGLVLGAGTGLALHYGYRWLRKKEGLGFGDVKFLAVAGLWLTLKPFIPFLFFAGLFGIVTAGLWRLLGRGELFPFGPALAASLFLCVAWPWIAALFWSIGQLAQ
jgi:prepilin signal peptidase PulO-like enzyme (type II secretory pathway)